MSAHGLYQRLNPSAGGVWERKDFWVSSWDDDGQRGVMVDGKEAIVMTTVMKMTKNEVER